MIKSLEAKGYITYGRFRLGPKDTRSHYLIAQANGDPTAYTSTIGRFRGSGLVRPIKPEGFTFRLDVPRPEDCFFLIAREPLAALAVLEGDLLLFEHGRAVAPDDIVLFAVGEVDEEDHDPYYFLARYVGLTDRSLLPEIEKQEWGHTEEFVNRELQSPEKLHQAFSKRSDGTIVLLKGVTEEAEQSEDYKNFSRLLLAGQQQVRIVASQIGLLRLVSHWQRNGNRSPY
jgi:hypothetical protein